MIFADKVRALLKRDRYSQSDLAEAVGTNQPQVSRWLESPGLPSIGYLMKIARFFRVSIDYLVDDSQEEPLEFGELPDDESAVLAQYRDLKATGMIDRARATAGLAIASKLRIGPDGEPLVTGDTEQLGPQPNLTESTRKRLAEAARPKPPAKTPPTTDLIPAPTVREIDRSEEHSSEEDAPREHKRSGGKKAPPRRR